MFLIYFLCIITLCLYIIECWCYLILMQENINHTNTVYIYVLHYGNSHNTFKPFLKWKENNAHVIFSVTPWRLSTSFHWLFVKNVFFFKNHHSHSIIYHAKYNKQIHKISTFQWNHVLFQVYASSNESFYFYFCSSSGGAEESEVFWWAASDVHKRAWSF